MPGLEMPKRGAGAEMLRDLRDEERSPVVIEEESYDNMTNKLSGKPTDKQENQQASKKTEKPTRNQANKPYSQQTRNQETLEASVSVAQLIRQRARQPAEPPVLKTVTLKLSTALDERIERYCFEHKMKKQDFWAEAAALYFETVEEDGNAGG